MARSKKLIYQHRRTCRLCPGVGRSEIWRILVSRYLWIYLKQYGCHFVARGSLPSRDFLAIWSKGGCILVENIFTYRLLKRLQFVRIDSSPAHLAADWITWRLCLPSVWLFFSNSSYFGCLIFDIPCLDNGRLSTLSPGVSGMGQRSVLWDFLRRKRMTDLT